MATKRLTWTENGQQNENDPLTVVKEPIRWYQDGAYRKAYIDTPKWDVKQTIYVTFIFVAIGLASLLYAISGPEYHEQPLTPTDQQTANSNNQPLTICLKNQTKSIKPNFVATNEKLGIKYSIYNGLHSITEAYKLCHDPYDERDIFPSVYSRELDLALDNIVSKYEEELFKGDEALPTGMQKIVWIGGYIDLEFDEGNTIQWFGSKGKITEYYKNFCEPRKAKVWQKIEALAEAWRKDRRGTPIIHIVKDFRSSPKGCWRLFDNLLYDWRDLKFHVVCQTSAEMSFRRIFRETQRDMKTVYEEVFHGKLRIEEHNPQVRSARKYALFTEHGSYEEALDRCSILAPGAAMLAPVTLTQDYDINRLVSYYSNDIFGEDNGDPDRRTLIWTGGYYNLTSKYPLTLRWNNDPEAVLDLEPSKIEEYGFSAYKSFEFENFCAPIEAYEKMVQDAIEERSRKAENCLKTGLMVLVKDYRVGQANQGCWHVYDLDYLIENKFELYLMCQLPEMALESPEIRKEHTALFDYSKDSKEP